MNTLSKVFPKVPILEMSLSDFSDHFASSHELILSINEQFNNLEQSFEGLSNLIEIRPLIISGKEELAHLIGANITMISSDEGFGDVVRTVFVKIKNFFIKLLEAIVAFFRRMFNVNTRTRHTLNTSITTFYRKRSTIADERTNVLSVYVISAAQFNDIVPILNTVVDDLLAASKSMDVAEATTFHSGIGRLGYMVSDHMIVETTSTKQVIPIARRFAELGWTMDDFVKASQTLSNLCLRCEEANIVKGKLENELKAGMRKVDMLTNLSKTDEAIQLQNSLNDLSKRSSFVFKCSAILQSYVEQLSIQFLDTWQNINNLSYN